VDLAFVDDLLPAPQHRWQPGDAYLAGGTWLFSTPQPDVRRLLDLRAFGWDPLVASADGLEIAATCTLAELAAYRAGPPLFRECCTALLGSFKIWNEATVGGNLCCALPAGPMIALTTALDATFELWTPTGDIRVVPAAQFVTGPGTTVLAPGELLRAIRVPAATLAAPTASRQMSLATHGRSAAFVIGRRGRGGLVITVTGSTPRPVVVRVPLGTDVPGAVGAAVPEWFEDVHGDARWRAAMTLRLAAEVAAELAKR
jgi:CO/xanthine dehydrogenase FAD-binding subunit